MSLALPQPVNTAGAPLDDLHLLSRLDAGLWHRLALLMGPAGYGKTTLLRRWVESRQHRTAWVALQHEDNVPQRFLADLVAALRVAQVGVQVARAHELQDSMIDLINALVSVPDALVVVLDHYHVIDSQDIHQAMQLWLDYLPPQTHLVIASRVEPPLELARLRVRRQLVEITLRANAPSEEEHNE